VKHLFLLSSCNKEVVILSWTECRAKLHTAFGPLDYLLPQVRVAVEQERHEPRVHLAHLVGHVDELTLVVCLQVTPAVLATEVAVHQADGTTGFEDLRDLVERGQRKLVGVARLMQNTRCDARSSDAPLLERVDENLVAIALDLVPILPVAAQQHVADERPRVVVWHGSAVLAEIRRTPDVQLDGLEVGRALLDDELGLVERLVRVFHVGNENPALASDEPFPGESLHLFGGVLAESDQRQLVHLVVQHEAGSDGDALHSAPMSIAVGVAGR